MARNINAIEGKPRAVADKVLVADMHFGEQKTASGIILTNDDGKARGIYPRWGRVYSKGPASREIFEEGHWILVEHGRWTRGFKINDGSKEMVLRMIDPDAILAYSDEKPDTVQIGDEA